LKQRLVFLFQGKIKSLDRLAIIQEQKTVEIMVRFSISRKVETMNRLAIIEEQQIVETTVRFSI